MTSKNSTVIIIDDDASVQKALGRLLKAADYQVITYTSASDFLKTEHIPRPACLIVDICMPDISGLDLQNMLGSSAYAMPMIFLTGFGSIHMSVQAMKNGAHDFLTKPVEEKDLLHAVRLAIEKDLLAQEQRSDLQEARARIAHLTPREYETFTYVITGMLNKQIAYELNISEKTVKVHRGRVMEKLNMQSVAELVRFAEKNGIQPAK